MRGGVGGSSTENEGRRGRVESTALWALCTILLVVQDWTWKARELMKLFFAFHRDLRAIRQN